MIWCPDGHPLNWDVPQNAQGQRYCPTCGAWHNDEDCPAFEVPAGTPPDAYLCHCARCVARREGHDAV